MADGKASTELVELKSSSDKNSTASADSKSSLGLPTTESKGDLTREKSSLKPELGKQKSKAPKNNKGDLDAQTKLFSEKGNIFSCAYAADDVTFFELVKNNGWQICQQVGPVGDCPFLILFLIHSPKHLDMAKQLVDTYPELIFSEYKAERPGGEGEDPVPTPLYFGETALHLAVVNKNEELVDFLLQKQKELHDQNRCMEFDLLTMPAQGVFFAPPLDKGPCYYGEVPLGFAACTANVALCNKLLHTYGSYLQFEDSHGNNLLHLLAMHNLPEMFRYILQEEKQSAKATEKDYVPLASRPNKEGMTPLSLAACSGNKEVFGAIIDASKVTVWTYGPIEMIKFPLSEIDTLDLVTIDKLTKGESVAESEGDRTGIIELLIREGQLDLLMQNVLIDVLDNKWTRYAFRRYLFRCAKQSILILSVTFSLILGYPDPSNYSFEDAERGVSNGFRILFEIIVVYMVATKGFSELQEMRGAGLRDYYGDVGVAFLENALSSSYCFFIFCVVIVRIVGITLREHFINVEGNNSPTVFGPLFATNGTADPNNNYEFPSVTQYTDIFLQSIAVMLIYLYALTLLLGFRLTGQFVIMIYKMLKNDVLRFCLVFFLFILGFGTSFLALQSVPQPTPASGWQQMFDNLYGMFQLLTGGVDTTFIEFIAQDWGGFFHGVGTVVTVFFNIVMNIMLLNLLIAMMGDTYGIVKEAVEMEYIQYKAQIIMSLENEMSASDWKKISPYWIMDNGRPWLQMQIKNQQFLQNNAAGGGQSALIAPAPAPVQSAEEKFKGADVDGDGNVSQGELAAFEKDLRAKLELEFLQRIALGPQLPSTQPSLFVNASEIKGNGFSRDGVFQVSDGS